ncbi:acetyl-CoA decarbonylase/synthase complex subunit gamma [Methanosarcinaceae archaeon]|nr:acetyl-CoA decarbonylase/synthase complex subunit gamma [Methanosarcinaceae archaeon]
MKANSPLDIYPYLPDVCEKVYGEKKMAVAAHLVSRVYSFEDFSEKITALMKDDPSSGKTEEERIKTEEERIKTEKDLRKLEELLAPAVREVRIGCGEKAVTIGGDDVLFRHTLTFYNKTPVAVDVHDMMTSEELKSRLQNVTDFRKFYVGKFLTLDAVAVRSVSGIPEIFAACVSAVAETGFPVILCTKDPALMEAGLKAAEGQNPLMYAADERNRNEMFSLARKFDVPLVISAPGDLNLLKSIVISAKLNGITKIVLDPGTFTGDRFRETFQNLIKIRAAAVSGKDDADSRSGHDTTLAWPILILPIKTRCNAGKPTEGSGNSNADRNADGDADTNAAGNADRNEAGNADRNAAGDEKDSETERVEKDYEETLLTAVSIIRYADLVIIHGAEPHELLPVVHVADMIYTDPRKPNAVAPGLYDIGTPDDASPVLFTTNFALTYYTVESDLTSAGISCRLLAVNTGGLGVEAAVAGSQLTAQTVREEIERTGLDLKATTHKTLIIPGLAARLQGDLEKRLGIRVLTGPTDSGRLPKWLEENGFITQEKKTQ